LIGFPLLECRVGEAVGVNHLWGIEIYKNGKSNIGGLSVSNETGNTIQQAYYGNKLVGVA